MFRVRCALSPLLQKEHCTLVLFSLQCLQDVVPDPCGLCGEETPSLSLGSKGSCPERGLMPGPAGIEVWRFSAVSLGFMARSDAILQRAGLEDTIRTNGDLGAQAPTGSWWSWSPEGQGMLCLHTPSLMSAHSLKFTFSLQIGLEMALNPVQNDLGSLAHELIVAGSGSTCKCRCKNVSSPRTNPEIPTTVTGDIISSLFPSLDFLLFFFMNLRICFGNPDAQ